jgi:excinuclease ABC subunit C
MRRPPTAEIPDAPGSYLFRDRNGRVVYVGKAKSLRKRVGSYFSRDLHPRTQTMIDTAETVEWIVADSEVAALMLEYSLIKQHRPRFNVRLVDDKSYPYLAITRGDEWPRARVMRGAKRKPTEYFGPYAHAYAIRSTLDQLLRTFPVRTCSDGVFRRQQAQGRPCLLFHIEKCVGPCIGAVEPDRYVELVDGLAAFLRGDTDGIVEDLEKRMWDAAGREDFEQAARFRDRLEDVRRAIERQEIVTDRREDFDLLALHGDDLETSLQVLHVRRGRVVGRLGAMIDRVEELTDAELAESVIRDLYIDEVPPPLIVVAEEPADLEAMRVWLAERRGSAVEVRVPQRGAKRRLLENAQVNAREAFGRHRLKRQSDHNARARALRSLQEILELPEAPLRIEAFDISTLQGTNTVASMVVMEDGLPRRSDYRRFKIRTVEGQDDFASMEEVISRRFQNYLREMNKPVEEQTRFRYPPTLIVIDGGPAQLGRATKAMADAGVSIPAIGLAKRLEEVYVPGQAEPIRIRRDAEALYLLQQIRDEAHRFAITYHRSIRSKSMLDSILDEVPGIGPTRKKALLKRFGSLIRLRDATKEEMAAVIPTAVASQLYAALHGGHDGQEQ